MSRTPLTDEEISAALEGLPGWYVDSGRLALRRELPSFLAAIAFVQEVAFVAEELDHHPDIDIRWRTVTLSVSTHDAGNVITGKDVELAQRVSAG